MRRRPKTAADLMTRKVITVPEDESLGTILAGMETFRFRHLPVVDGDRLVGLVTHRDLLRASSSSLREEDPAEEANIASTPVRTIMRREVLTVGVDEPLEKIARMMLEAKIGCVCVLDDDERLVGLLTESDFVVCAQWFLMNH